MKDKGELTKKQLIITGAVSSLGMIAIYTGGVNLAKSNAQYHNPIFISTVVVTMISPYLLKNTTTYVLKKYNEKQKKKIKNK